jgi:hypothetical protein
MRPYFDYLKSLLLHKWYVFVAGRYVGVSLWQLLIHDLSKFSPAEFLTYARHSSTEEGRESEAFAAAWLHHENANPHHWGYWIPRSGKYANQPLPMPDRYIREMVADWMGAGKAYTGRWDIADWLNENLPGFSDKLHPKTIVGVFLILVGVGIRAGTDGRQFSATDEFLEWAGGERP